MAMIHRLSFLIICAMMLFPDVSAQTAADAARNINAIKRDTTYLYAEATTSNLDSALYNAKALLEAKVSDWVRLQHPHEGVEICITKAKEHSLEVRTRRGNLQRAFVYVRKGDILTITDRSEVTVFHVAPATEEQPTVPIEVVSEESPTPQEAPAPVFTLTDEERQMLSITSLSALNKYVVQQRDKGRLNGYGKYSTMPKEADCHLFVCDKQAQVIARLRHQSDGTIINLNTLQPDAVENYNFGAIWFQIKN